MSSVILWVGAGILLLPRSLGVVGVGLGAILLVCFGRMCLSTSATLLLVLSALSCYVLKEIYKFTKAKTYAGMGSAVFGKGFGVFIDLFLVCYARWRGSNRWCSRSVSSLATS